ncbi:uracil-DNA glycosylase [Sphingomonas kaistensis]|uniref:Uracil-DNA glycosylase n=1 Tax=Sphingomonas kaistensis TaxID=298708 RepID=A0ABZ2FXQ7_9SPHN
MAALQLAHIAPLTDYVHSLRLRDTNEYPYFDPADGGVNASILFLFEKPGPMTVDKGSLGRVGSGLISRDNDDPTAEATFCFMREAGVPRTSTVTWNTVPGWNGTRRITSSELKAGVRDLSELLALLRKVRTIVLVGRKAERAEASIRELGPYALFRSPHPSPLVRASYPDRWSSIPDLWREAARHAGVWRQEG